MPIAALSEALARFDESLKPEEAEYALHLDEWVNSNTGIGTSRDKVTATQFVGSGRLPPSALEDLYHNDDVAARICDLIPETALRTPFTLSDPEVQAQMVELGVRDKFEAAWIFGRLHGGGPVILGGSGASNTPLTSGVRALFVSDRWSLSPVSFYTDTTNPKYGEPEFYQIVRPMFIQTGLAPSQAAPPKPDELIHESRVIVFPGARTSPRRKLSNGYWDDSVLQRVYGVVQAYGLTWASVVHLMQDAAQGVYALKDLWTMIVGGNKQAVEDRMRLVEEMRSSARAILVDAEHESFTRVPTPFTGIPELIDRMSERLASASGYPLTVLMGSSPAGMNATGQSDLELYYGRCEAQRQRVLMPAVFKLIKAMGKDPTKITVTCPPMWMPSAKEQAETQYAIAQRDNIYYQMSPGTLGEIIVKSRFTENGWTADMKIPADTKIEPPAPAGAPGAPGAQVGEGASTTIGTHHFSPKYGR